MWADGFSLEGGWPSLGGHAEGGHSRLAVPGVWEVREPVILQTMRVCLIIRKEHPGLPTVAQWVKDKALLVAGIAQNYEAVA